MVSSVGNILVLPQGRSDASPLAGEAAVLDAARAAIAAARMHVGATAPNPPVGCAVLDAAGRLLAVGAHARAGTPHAEVVALEACRAAGVLDAADTLVVTLEPCAHHGRTPPCVDAILGTAVRRVVIGAVDPNPNVLGGGMARLKAAGVECRLLSDLGAEGQGLAGQCRALIAGFAMRNLHGRPFITVKQALDARGSMIPPRGRTTFTSDASLELAHRLRRQSDAILTGVGTILADRPQFTVRRVPDHPGRRRLLAILDRQGRTPPEYIAQASEHFEVLVFNDLDLALRDLAGRGVLNLLVEAGPTLTRVIGERGLWDHWLTLQTVDGDASDRVTWRAAASDMNHKETPCFPE
jgi:diaminohydroxyphosphoribosylaminopyrimidine deaminase / 5-amino-6-(5-phosphoribosylamino)uracil reductase